MKVPPKRKGNFGFKPGEHYYSPPSMKVPPKRKGNLIYAIGCTNNETLNESPSEKEGKFSSSEPPGTFTLPQ